MNDEILYNIGRLIAEGAPAEMALIWAVDFYMNNSDQEPESETLH